MNKNPIVFQLCLQIFIALANKTLPKLDIQLNTAIYSKFLSDQRSHVQGMPEK